MITFEKFTNHIKYKEPNIQSHCRLRGDSRTWGTVLSAEEGEVGGFEASTTLP